MEQLVVLRLVSALELVESHQIEPRIPATFLVPRAPEELEHRMRRTQHQIFGRKSCEARLIYLMTRSLYLRLKFV